MDILDYGENPDNYWDNVARFEAARCLAALELKQQQRTENYEKVTMPAEEKKPVPKAPETRNERQPIIKNCAQCGKKFEAWWKSTLYCGDRCKRKA